MRIAFAIMASILSLSSAAALAAPAPADLKSAGIVRGSNFAFALRAPDGWVLDDKAGARQGFAAVFYPKGSSWSASPAVIYTNTADKSLRQNANIKNVMAYDAAQFKKNSAVLQASQPLRLITKNKRPAFLRTFTGELNGNIESVAYVDAPKVIVLLVLSARGPQEYRDAFPAFQDLVRSYRAVTPRSR